MLLQMLLLLLVGCAARHAGSGGRVVPYEPPKEVALEPEESPASTAQAPLLPGAERVYPSQEARNQASPGATEAFPAPGAPRPSESTPAAPPVEPAAELSPPAGDRSAETAAAEAPAAEDEPPPSPPTPPGTSSAGSAEPEYGVTVQLFASSSEATAAERARALTRFFDAPIRVVAFGGIHRVRLGPFGSRDAAEQARRRAVEIGVRDAFLVPPSGTGSGGH